METVIADNKEVKKLFESLENKAEIKKIVEYILNISMCVDNAREELNKTRAKVLEFRDRNPDSNGPTQELANECFFDALLLLITLEIRMEFSEIVSWEGDLEELEMLTDFLEATGSYKYTGWQDAMKYIEVSRKG